jgi:hypothetical protein
MSGALPTAPIVIGLPGIDLEGDAWAQVSRDERGEGAVDSSSGEDGEGEGS